MANQGETLLILGGMGYLGRRLSAAFLRAGHRVVISRTDIRNRLELNAVFRTSRPAVVVNCAGRTGKPTVDACEDHPRETWDANVFGAANVARACLEHGCRMVHFSSGCIYEGDRGFRESDAPNFHGSLYSRSKAAAEVALSRIGGKILVVRPRMPTAWLPGPRNLLTKIAAYRGIIQIPNSISIVDDLTAAAVRLVALGAQGVFNVVNPGAVNHVQILEIYREFVDPAARWTVIDPAELRQRCRAGRSNCTLNTDKLAGAGIRLPPILEALPALIRRYGAARTEGEVRRCGLCADPIDGKDPERCGDCSGIEIV